MNRFIATVQVAYGQGAMGPHYWGATRSAFGRSPRRAIDQATRLADRACGEGASWIPVVYQAVVKLDGRVVYDSEAAFRKRLGGKADNKTRIRKGKMIRK